MSLKLNFIGTWPSLLKEVGSRAEKALKSELKDDLPAGVINVKLVDDTEIASLNEKYTGNAYATDVLTFHYAEDGDPPEGELADIAISSETAASQAKASGAKLEDEIGLLVVHGVLHALGRDHASPQQRLGFEDLQCRILARAGIKYRDFKWKS